MLLKGSRELIKENDSLNKIILQRDDIDSENNNENLLLKTKVESLENELDISRTDLTNHVRQLDYLEERLKFTRKIIMS